MPDFSLERAFIDQRGGVVCGVDEAGRGPWAGPVVAGAAVLGPENLDAAWVSDLDDSKKLSPSRRQELYSVLDAEARCAVGVAGADEIDALNILQATLLAMARAVKALGDTHGVIPSLALVDGNRPPQLLCPAECVVECVVGGDGKSLSIAAASIVAKVHRDRIMAELALAHPGYGWERNAGYGTAEHQAALAALGVTIHHRKSFAPIRRLLEAQDMGGEAKANAIS